MDRESFLTEFVSLLGAEPSEIALQTELASLTRWDSIALMLYMALVEEKFGHVIKPDDIAAAKTVEDLYQLASRS